MLPKKYGWWISNPIIVWLSYSARSALAAAGALSIAGNLHLPEAYWSPISAVIVMHSNFGSAWGISRQRVIGTVLGAMLGGALATFFEPQAAGFAVALFGLGLACGLLRLDQSAFRFAGVALAIIWLVKREQPGWMIAIDRFVEVSLGIVVALSLSWIWPWRSSS